MSESKRRGRPIDPQVRAREEAVLSALENPSTSRGISEALDISVPAVRLSLKRLRAKGTISLRKIDGAFVWSRVTTD